MTSALFQLSADGGATFLAAGTPLAGAHALAYASSGSYAIRARLDSTAGVGNVAWSIPSADNVTLDAGPLPTPTVADDRSCSFSIPTTARTYLLRAVVNNGVDQATDGASQSLTQTLAIKVKTTGGVELVAVGERTEGNATYGWLPSLNAAAAGAVAGGASGIAKRLVVPVFHSLALTGQGADVPSAVAAFVWDPALYVPAGASGALVTFKAILSTTNASRASNVDLYRVTGATAGVVAGSPLSSTSLLEEEHAADMTSALLAAPAGIVRLRQWLGGSGAGDAALLSGARLEVSWS